MHHGGHGGMHHGGGGYDNYGQDPDEFYDMDDVWNNDKYNFGQQRYKRQSNMSSSTSGGNYSKSTPSPYQSQLYDSWKTEWNAPAYNYDQYPGRGGSSQPHGHSSQSGGEDSRHYSGGGRGSYMTKGGRRPSYDDDF